MGYILYPGSRGGTVERETGQSVVSPLNAKQIAQGEAEMLIGGEMEIAE